MNILRFCVLYVVLVVHGSLFFPCVAMESALARPPRKPKVLRPRVTTNPRVVVRLGKPYLAERRPLKK